MAGIHHRTAEQQTDPIITLIGVVDSIDPWVVNGIQLNVTDETEIQGEVTVGMIVRAKSFYWRTARGRSSASPRWENRSRPPGA
jgi:hypothetical protein